MGKYTFTGFMPSGNPFDWYYDEHKHMAFTTSLQVDLWDEKPSIGDIVEMTDGEVFINGKLVYVKSDENDRKREEAEDRLYNNIKLQKGLL